MWIKLTRLKFVQNVDLIMCDNENNIFIPANKLFVEFISNFKIKSSNYEVIFKLRKP
jgi:hypothetical protein